MQLFKCNIIKMNLSQRLHLQTRWNNRYRFIFLPKTTKKRKQNTQTMVCIYCTLGRAEKRSLKAGTQIKGILQLPKLTAQREHPEQHRQGTLAEPGSPPELSKRSSESGEAKESIELAGQKPRVMELYVKRKPQRSAEGPPQVQQRTTQKKQKV